MGSVSVANGDPATALSLLRPRPAARSEPGAVRLRPGPRLRPDGPAGAGHRPITASRRPDPTVTRRARRLALSQRSAAIARAALATLSPLMARREPAACCAYPRVRPALTGDGNGAIKRDQCGDAGRFDRADAFPAAFANARRRPEGRCGQSWHPPRRGRANLRRSHSVTNHRLKRDRLTRIDDILRSADTPAAPQSYQQWAQPRAAVAGPNGCLLHPAAKGDGPRPSSRRRVASASDCERLRPFRRCRASSRG